MTIGESMVNETGFHRQGEFDMSELSGAKRRLLQQLLSGESRKDTAEDPFVRRECLAEPLPLSFSQQQVWLHAQMTGDVPFYNETFTVYRQGPLDVPLLERCLAEIVRRHEIWRTTFDVQAGEPVQIVHPAPQNFPLANVDLSGVAEASRDDEARRLATADARRPFNLNAGPLLRALLIKMGGETHRLYMTIHQVVFDAVTAYNVFLPELITLYEAFVSGLPASLPEPGFQYSDFAGWQRKKLMAGAYSQQLVYWRNRLAGDLPVLEWPNDRQRPSIETHRGAIERFSFNSEVVQKLTISSRQHGVTPFTTLLAGLATLLHRYSGQDEIVLGTFTAARKRKELEPLAGYFVNPLPLRIDLSGNPTFCELQSRVRGLLLDALAHDDVPFVHIVKEAQARPDPSRNPLFQVALSQQPKLPQIGSGWDMATEEICNGGSKLDLMIVVDNRDDNIFGPITYNPDLFDASTVRRMIGHWQMILGAAALDANRRIADLPLLTEAERDQILVQWNDTKAEYPGNACLHELIENEVDRSSHAPAVVCGHTRLSYRELNDRANQLARYLQRLGVCPQTLVGICMERSTDMVVALLAILKAGGAYVPLDPAYPKARLEFMIADSALRFLVSQSDLRFEAAGFTGKLVCVDRDWPAISQERKDNPKTFMGPESPAYVIYTSGSTGHPKGVQIPHRALVNLLTSMQRQPGLRPQDSLLAVTTISFDIAALELYLPLIVGARCVLASREVASDGRQLRELLENSYITVMQATPSTWKLLIEVGWTRRSNLKILCGGEPMSPELGGQLLERASAVWNMYGPTETTVWSSIYRIRSFAGPVLIGHPVANTEMYVLDRNLQPVPVGTTGELFIGGDGLALGYLNRPDLDAEKFVLNPFGGERGSRLYRTGDLAQYQEDGNIECLGRVDHQVKVRGFRIELGEIESVLREHPKVVDACAIVREDVAGDRRLVAYVVTRTSQSALDELKDALKAKLPTYMIPSLVSLERLPLTPNGKLDRRALPPPTDAVAGEQETATLEDPIEQLLAGIWKDLLKVQQVGVYDNFFDLGGHSLLATQVVARLENELGVRIKPKELAFQTLGQFAASCRARLQAP
jgi:amino acid adenylation domain-containing protein